MTDKLPTDRLPTNQLPTKLTVVIPARNEKDGVEHTIRAIPKAQLERNELQGPDSGG